MQALVTTHACVGYTPHFRQLADEAMSAADALIEALNKPRKQPEVPT